MDSLSRSSGDNKTNYSIMGIIPLFSRRDKSPVTLRSGWVIAMWPHKVWPYIQIDCGLIHQCGEEVVTSVSLITTHFGVVLSSRHEASDVLRLFASPQPEMTMWICIVIVIKAFSELCLPFGSTSLKYKVTFKKFLPKDINQSKLITLLMKSQIIHWTFSLQCHKFLSDH